MNWHKPKKPRFSYRLGLNKTKDPYSMGCDYKADGLGTKQKSLECITDPRFMKAWEIAAEVGYKARHTPVADIRWRAHIAIWAMENGLHLEGDFVECGVFTGLLSLTGCHYHDFSKVEKNFWLFDTWEGVPTTHLSGEELKHVRHSNEALYNCPDVYDLVKDAFSQFPNCHLIKGILPDTLKLAKIDKISYLSIDLNNAAAEEACIEQLWSKLVKGAIVLLDDYGFSGYEPQKKMWDKFAASKGTMIVTLPTGQGILIRC
jgi:O-methyltransferase